MSGIIVEEQSFASVLKSLMKKYRISGQKIADRIGKSQKTVSRYATGEVVPKKKIQEQVLQAVSEIAGYSTEDLVAEGKEIKRVWELKTVTLGSARREAYKERREQAEKWAVRVFALLPEEKQKFMLDFFDLYAELKMYEMEMVDNFRRIPAEKEQVIMDIAYFLAMRKDQEKKDALEQYRALKYGEFCDRISQYQWEPESRDKYLEIPELEEETELESKFARKLADKSLELGQIQRLGIRLVDMINYRVEDWRFLSYIQVIYVQDEGTNYTRDYQIVGDEVYMLMCWLEKLAEKQYLSGYGIC